MKKLILFLALVFSAFFAYAERVAILPDLTEPSALKVDNGKIYIIDGARILIYSREDFRLVKKLGRAGEGPGEFRSYFGGRHRLYIDVQSDEIWVSSNEKLSVFDKNFLFKEDHKLPAQIGFNNKVGNCMVGSNYFWEKNPNTTEQVILFKRKNKDYAYTKTVYKTGTGKGRLRGLNPGKINDYNVIPHTFDVQVWKQKVFIGDTNKGFFIAVFDQQGNPLYEIKKTAAKVPVSEDDRRFELTRFKSERFWQEYKHLINPVFPEFFPALRQFRVANNRIYVFTYKKVSQKGEVLVLDLSGKLLGKTKVPINKYFSVYEDKYYYLNKNDDQEWELLVKPLFLETTNEND
jgi:hypothetical protein